MVVCVLIMLEIQKHGKIQTQHGATFLEQGGGDCFMNVLNDMNKMCFIDGMK